MGCRSRVSELEGVAEVGGSSSLVREISPVDSVFPAMEESWEVTELGGGVGGGRWRPMLSAGETGVLQSPGLGSEPTLTGCVTLDQIL